MKLWITTLSKYTWDVCSQFDKFDSFGDYFAGKSIRWFFETVVACVWEILLPVRERAKSYREVCKLDLFILSLWQFFFKKKSTICFKSTITVPAESALDVGGLQEYKGSPLYLLKPPTTGRSQRALCINLCQWFFSANCRRSEPLRLIVPQYWYHETDCNVPFCLGFIHCGGILFNKWTDETW